MNHIVELLVLTAFKGWFYIWIFICTGTFKSNDPLSSTEDIPLQKIKLATEKWKWWRWNNKNIPQTVFNSTRPTWTLSLSSAINFQCLLHWTKRPGSQIKCFSLFSIPIFTKILFPKYLVILNYVLPMRKYNMDMYRIYIKLC